ncbi:hypothetical protein ACFL96_13025 [Thermoproteota archaeon]
MDTLNISKLLLHYKNPELQRAIVEHSKNKEVAVKFGENGFGKRPDTIQYPSDVLELAKQGATSFHVSEEIWKNPLRLDISMRKEDMNDLRLGWDLVIDIDCKWLEYSQMAGDLIVKALKHNGIKSVSVKFSGNHGFHLGVPFEAFPKKVHGKETRTLFPEAPRKIALYLGEMIGKHLSKEILKKDDINSIVKKTGMKFNELVVNGEFDAFKILEIDTLLISSRHLYRMPYCFNEKSGLVSIPIDPDKIMEFDKEIAKPENVKPSRFSFLDRANIKKDEAESLIIQAYDFGVKQEEEIRKELKGKKQEGSYQDFEALQEAVPEDLFPPCIKIGLQGLEDGRKRFVFMMLNFLTSAGWDYEKIKERLKEWNKKNREPLREVNLVGPLRYHKQNKKKILPPNCGNSAYYKGIGICRPDGLCARIRNPLNYAKKRSFAMRRAAGKTDARPKLTEEQKAMRREHRKKMKETMKDSVKKKSGS